MHKEHLHIQANGKNAVIELKGKIDPKANFFEAFDKEMTKLEAAGVTKAKLEINSVGGSVIQGIKIYNRIEESPIEVTKEVVMLAASMSAVIAAGGFIRPNARMMFHKPFMQDLKGSANSTDLRTLADMLDKFEAKMINMVAVSTELGEDEIKAKFFKEGQDVWLTSTEAIESGIMKGLSDAKANASIPSNWLELASYDVAAKFSTHTEFKTPKNKMEETEILALAQSLDLKAGANLDDVKAEIVKLKPLKEQNEVLKQKIENLEASAKKDKEAKAVKLVADALAQGKILESEKAEYEADAKANYELVERSLSKIPAKKDLSKTGGSGSGSGFQASADRKDWDYNKWLDADPKGFAALDKEAKDSIINAYINS